MRSPAKTTFEVILVIAVLIAIAIAPVAAEARHPGKHGPAPFSDFDADGDGLVSETEFNDTRAAHMAKMAEDGKPMKGAASAPAFADMDQDGDGMLNEEELTAGQKAHRAAMRGERKGKMHRKHMKTHKKMHKQMHGHGEGMKMPTFEDIDTDGDGVISREEFAAHHAEHHGKAHQE